MPFGITPCSFIFPYNKTIKQNYVTILFLKKQEKFENLLVN
jgi:hypothetical protein